MSVAASVTSNELPRAESVMAQARRENFPVATLLLGRRYRRHLLAIYGFARLVDDIGDEAAGDRGMLLDRVERELTQIYSGATPQHPVMAALRPTVQQCRLPREPFQRLLEANRRDQVITRYDTFDQLLDYCQLSAAPVGELVLHIFGLNVNDRLWRSDRVCAGLQVVEHLQDVAEDYARGRIYLPQADLRAAGCSDADLAADHASPQLRRVIAVLAERSARLLADGVPLLRGVSPRPRAALAGFIAGGRAALAGLERVEYDVLAHRSRPSRAAVAAALLQLARGR